MMRVKAALVAAVMGVAGAAVAQEDVVRVAPPHAVGPVRVVHALKMEKAAFLGITTSPLPPIAREQLKLPRGIGLAVEMVDPGSPAADAGVKPMDVLHKLDDQLLVSQDQLGVLVRTHQPGDEVTLTVIRQGERMMLKAKLTEREMPVLPEIGGMGLPPHVIRAIEGNEWFPGPGMGAVTVTSSDAQTEIVWADPQHKLRLTSKDGKRHLVATDAEGKEVFNGPIDTDEQRQAIPEDVREKLKKLEQSSRVQIMVGPTTRPMRIIRQHIEQKQ